MKTVKIVFLGLAILAGFVGFASSKTNGIQEPQKAKVNVYYFHFKARCETCRTVESEARKNVEELFGGAVKFTAVNLDEVEGAKIGKEMGVNSQMLLIVKDKNKINITNEGFMYARTNPDKLKQAIREAIAKS